MAGLKALIPLDGTKLSEHAFELLPLLKTMGFDSVRLVSVWESAWEETESGRKEQDFGEATEKGRSYLEAYLDQQAATVRAAGFEPEPVVRIGRAADEVVEASKGVDLVLIATHGRSGISRWWLGSVADKVVRDVECPVLLIGPNVHQDLAPGKITRILLPLDGSDQAEEAIPVATWIARLTNSEIEAVRCMSLTPVAYDPSMSIYSADLINSLQEAVEEYLAGVQAKLGSKATTTMLVGGAGELLIEYLEEHPAGLVVMTSHGRSGVRRVALGSVTDRLLHGPAPVLVVRAGGGLLAKAKSAS